MKRYRNIDELKKEFLQGDFDFDQKEFKVGDVDFQFLGESTAYSMLDILTKNYKSMIVYNAKRNPENEERQLQAKMAGWIVFLWGMDDRMRLVPYDVRNTTKARASVHITEEESLEDRIIADKVPVKMLDLPVARDIVAKVDTGAEVTSLHATDIEIKRSTEGNMVSFNCQELSNNRFTVPLIDQQPVKVSNGDTANRPVIKLSLKIKDKVLKDILVNLNDRSSMDDPMLLGQNALEAGNFLVDPNLLKDSVEFDPEFLAEVQADVVPATRLDREATEKLFEALQEAGTLTIDDLLRVLRTKLVENFDDIQY